MTVAAILDNNTNAGEISPLLEGRPDLRPYANGLRKCINAIPLAQGPTTRRPGTMYVAAPKSNTKKARLVRFEYSTTQAYILEIGDLYIRFFRNEGRLENPPGTPVEVVTTYAEADIFALRFSQSADTLYITHPNYPPKKLIRNSSISWTLTTITFRDGPYLPLNTTATTLTPSGTTGSVTVTASAATFVASDVGRQIRIQHSTTWGSATITAYTNSTTVTATVDNAFGATTAVATWRLGLWGATNGYPLCSTFYGDRLYFAGCTKYPDRLDGSVVGDYENFAPSNTSGVVGDANAVSFTLNSSDVNAVFWMEPDEKGLLVGTAAAEWTVRPSTIGEALTPTNVNAVRSTTYGSRNVAPVVAGKGVLFVQRAGRKIRELSYVFADDGFHAPDVSILSEHLTVTGVKELSYQSEPQSIVWVLRNDGTPLSLTYEKAQEVYGWARHRLGGDTSLDIFDPLYSTVESVATIPASDAESDETWFLVNRTLNGTQVKSIEYLTPLYLDSDDPGERYFVDMGAIYTGAPTITISGLSWFPNGTVLSVLADGATHPNVTVTGGSITLVRAATNVHVGLGYISDMETLRINGGSPNGTSQGKIKRIHKVVLRFFQTLGVKYGPSVNKLDPYVFRRTSDPMGAPPPYLDGDTRDILWQGGYETTGRIYIRQDQPLPLTVIAIMPTLDTQN